MWVTGREQPPPSACGGGRSSYLSHQDGWRARRLAGACQLSALSLERVHTTTLVQKHYSSSARATTGAGDGQNGSSGLYNIKQSRTMSIQAMVAGALIPT